MNVIVFGATGGVGHHVVEQALAAGHCVTAVARRPEAIAACHERLKVVRGDVLEPAGISGLVAGRDTVVSALGADGLGPTSVYSDGIAAILVEMRAAGVDRLLCLSASGLDPGPLWQRVLAKPILWRVFKHSYTDLARMEGLVRASGTCWTILRPPRFTDGPRTGRYFTAINQRLTHGSLIARADVADFIVRHLDDPATEQAMVELAY
jgi:putative NADH-flavin reductase